MYYNLKLKISPEQQIAYEEKLGEWAAALAVEENEQNLLLTIMVEDSQLATVEKLLKNEDYTINPLVERDWTNEWLNEFTGVEVSPQIFIYPQGKNPLSKYPLAIELDMKDAFGAGTHPTTKLCLGYLYDLAQKEGTNWTQYTVLDVGSGTGVLAIAAAKLGASKILAFDLEADSVRQNKKNCQLNQVEEQIDVYQADLKDFELKKKYDLVVANVLTEVILQNIQNLKERLKPSGKMILSGIGNQWRKEIENAFLENNLVIEQCREDQNWLGYLLKNKFSD